MKGRLIFLIKLYISWMMLFTLLRVIFLLYYAKNCLSFKLSLQSIYYGWKMDASLSAYLLLPVCTFSLIGLFFAREIIKKIISVLNIVFLGIILFLSLVDIGLYSVWGFRLDATPLKYVHNPREMWASISHLPLVWIAVGFILIFFLLSRFFLAFTGNTLFSNISRRGLQFIFTLLFMGVLIIPLRGGIQLTPLNQSSVYFTSHNFSNLAAINPVWNLMYSLDHQEADIENPYQFFSIYQADNLVDSLYRVNCKPENWLRNQSDTPVNVILIVWESFTKKVIGLQRDGIAVTPGYNQLMKEGLYISGMLASGDRTDKGIVAVLSGYPAQPTTSILKNAGKAQKLPVLTEDFRRNAYQTSFYYGGETEFANMKLYLLHAGFEHFITKDDFRKEDLNSKWGAHDGVVAAKIVKDVSTVQQPFFITWLTLSSHEPFETPVSPVFAGRGDEQLFLNAMHYSDSVIYHFINTCKKQQWWKNTLLVIVPDHGSRLPASNSMCDNFKVSALLLGGALKKTGTIIDKPVSQTDLPATLLQQLGWPTHRYRWSRTMADTASNNSPWAYYSFNNGFGFVTPAGNFVYDNIGKQIIEQQGEVTPKLMRAGKAMQQMTVQDYLDK